jgi:signal transduction histidine kinase
VGEARESPRTPLWIALAATVLAVVGGMLLVAGAVDALAAAGRASARSPADEARIEAARSGALGRSFVAILLGGAVAAAGATLGGKLLERERARQRTARARGRLARLGLLAGTLAQELREPLQELRGRIAQIPEQVDEPPSWSSGTPTFEVCEPLLASLDQIEAILRDFVAYARPDPSPPRIVDVALLLREWCASLESELAARDLALVLEGAELPAAAIAEPVGLKVVVWSLVRNARDAAPRGSVVRVTLARGHERVKLRVADRGAGIAPERREEVFEPFASTKPDGLGLGLAVAQRLVEAMGASLVLAGGPPGAVFEVALRRAPASVRYFGLPAPARKAA